MDTNCIDIEMIEIDLIPERYQDIAEAIGIKALIELSKSFGGTALYIPQIENVIKPIRDSLIKKEFDGGNYTKLALKYKLSERYIRYLINGN